MTRPTDNGTLILTWKFASPEEQTECSVVCGQTFIVCDMEVEGVSCINNTELISVATFYPPCERDVNLSCINGGNEKTLPISVKGMFKNVVIINFIPWCVNYILAK